MAQLQHREWGIANGYITQWQPEVDFGWARRSVSPSVGRDVMAEVRPLMGCDVPPWMVSVKADCGFEMV